MHGRKSFFSKILLLFLLIILVGFGYFFLQELQKRRNVESQISEISKQIAGLEKNNDELTDLIEYLRSPSFQEKEIRGRLNLQRPGEHAVALSDEGGAQKASGPASEEKMKKQDNWKLWWDYFFGQ